jgi:N-acetylmuramoyl-L-alanine amidase
MREWFRYLWISIILWYIPVAFADEARLSDIVITTSPNTKIVLSLDQTVPYKVFTLPNPSRLIVDLQKTKYDFTKGKSLDFSGTDVTDYRHGIQDGYNLRMVFDLKESMNFNVETNHEKGFQVILNLSSSSKKAVQHAASETPPAQAVLQAQLKKQIDAQIKDEAKEVPEEAVKPKAAIPAKVEKTGASDKNESSDVSSQAIVKSKAVVPVKMAVSDKTEDKKSEATPPKAVQVTKTDQTVKVVQATKVSQAVKVEKTASSNKTETLDDTVAVGTTPSVAPSSVPSSDISTVKPSTKKRRFIVVIDAGHGGKDPGAAGPSGSHEKNVTLAIAKKLQALVNAEPGMKAVLTRSGDYYVGLRQRLMIARKAKGDVFIAIHADAFNEPDAEGASVFALSLHGSSSEAALWLAQKENYSELGGIDLNGIQDQDTQVRSVLIDLSQTATIAGSLQLGRSVIQQMKKLTELHHGVVEQAPFMVLKSPDIPSILVETGFLTNPKEEERLKTDAYQEKIARAIMSGVEEYYTQNVPTNISVATAA